MNGINDLIDEGKKRHSAFTKARKPFGWISLAWGVYSFCRNNGQLSFPVVALCILAGFLGYYAIPNTGNSLMKGVRLFLRRVLALVIDLFVIGFVISGLMWWYRAQIEPPDDVL